jgi:hypothetical protein
MTADKHWNATAEEASGCLVVILYESQEALNRALELCDRIMTRLWADLNIEVAHWHIDELAASIPGEEATAKAATADIVVVAASKEGEFSRGFTLWVERWLAQRERREGALVGLLHPEARKADESSSRDRQLHRLALRAGMDYLNHLPTTRPHSIPDVTGWCTSRADTVTSTLNQIIRTESRQTPG